MAPSPSSGRGGSFEVSLLAEIHTGVLTGVRRRSLCAQLSRMGVMGNPFCLEDKGKLRGRISTGRAEGRKEHRQRECVGQVRWDWTHKSWEALLGSPGCPHTLVHIDTERRATPLLPTLPSADFLYHLFV